VSELYDVPAPLEAAAVEQGVRNAARLRDAMTQPNPGELDDQLSATRRFTTSSSRQQMEGVTPFTGL
jgi:hypothetical protein